MNKKNLISGILAIVAVATFSACTAPAGDAVLTDTKPADGPLTLSAIDDRDTATHFRAVGIGTNKDFATAKDISLAHARTQLANKVKTRVENSINSTTVAKDVNGENVITTTTREMISKQTTDQTLSEMQQFTATLSEKNAQGDYVVYVGLEVPREVVKNAMVAGIDNVAKGDPAVAAIKENLKAQAVADLLKSGL